MSARDSKERFSDRVEAYVRYRPNYPEGALELLRSSAGLRPGADVADIGAGTGIFSAQLLGAGARVWAVEPNAAMRAAAESALGGRGGYRSVAGSAEATSLAGASVDLAVAAQAFHWFDAAAFRSECRRILRPPGFVALLWNDRLTCGDPFLEGYEAVLKRLALDYVEVSGARIGAGDFARFFGEGRYVEHVLPHAQVMDWEGVLGRALSSSYVPPQGHPRYDRFFEALRELFEKTAVEGRVCFRYRTRLALGALVP